MTQTPSQTPSKTNEHPQDHPKSAAVFERLDTLGITYKVFDHEPVFSVEDGLHLHDIIPGGHCKNLFLKDKRGQYWLISAIESTKIDLKLTEKLIGSARLSFGSEQRLSNVLGVKPGSVTPFALMNDESLQTNPILDKNLFDHDQINFHPLHNHQSVMLSPSDLILYIKSFGFEPRIVDLSGMSY